MITRAHHSLPRVLLFLYSTFKRALTHHFEMLRHSWSSEYYFQQMYRLDHPESDLFILYNTIVVGSKHPNQVWMYLKSFWLARASDCVFKITSIFVRVIWSCWPLSHSNECNFRGEVTKISAKIKTPVRERVQGRYSAPNLLLMLWSSNFVLADMLAR